MDGGMGERDGTEEEIFVSPFQRTKKSFLPEGQVPKQRRLTHLPLPSSLPKHTPD